MHFIGIFKVLYGPNMAEIFQIVTDDGKNQISKYLWRFILCISLIVTFIFSTLGIIGAIKYFSSSDYFKFLTLSVFVFIGMSSSALAYARFRTPISAFLILYGVLLISDLTNRRVVFKSWLGYRLRIK